VCETEHHADFERWSDNIVRGTSRPDDEMQRAEIRQSNNEMRAYFQKAIAMRRKEPRIDLLTALVQAEEERQALTANEVLAMAMLILLAGNETTRNLLGNTALMLLAQPAVLAKVRGDRALVPKLIEEVLRFDSPVQIVFRRTTKEVEVSGTAIPADATVFVLIGSANRDERRFSDPDRFDLERDNSDHRAFGFSTHFCLGAQLARLEAKVALEELLFSCPTFVHGIDPVERVRSVLLRGIQRLPLRFAV
jgi:cytochrome P450